MPINVFPARAGIQRSVGWIPAFAGMTVRVSSHLRDTGLTSVRRLRSADHPKHHDQGEFVVDVIDDSERIYPNAPGMILSADLSNAGGPGMVPETLD
jgi:hypothetical protein